MVTSVKNARYRTATPSASKTAVTSAAKPPSSAPTPLLVLLLLTIALGTTISIFTSSPATLDARSRLPVSALNAGLLPTSLPYFADKRNFLNQLFVKKAWAWTTGLWLTFVVAQAVSVPVGTKAGSIIVEAGKQAVVLSHIRRWVIATTYWYYLTQATWFLGVGTGPSLAHRLLLQTGAQCVPSPHTIVEGAQVCIGAKGEYWTGGHDVSGHVFLLMHAILFLYSTISPVLPSLFTLFSTNSPSSFSSNRQTPPTLVKASCWAILGLGAVWWWMLLMTSLYFHSPAEKVTGALFAVLGWAVSTGKAGRVVGL